MFFKEFGYSFFETIAVFDGGPDESVRLVRVRIQTTSLEIKEISRP